jgi:hypothetical protein
MLSFPVLGFVVFPAYRCSVYVVCSAHVYNCVFLNSECNGMLKYRVNPWDFSVASEAHPASYTLGTGGKAAGAVYVYHSLPSSAEVKAEGALC